MQEFESISASSYDPSALATKLTAKAAEGWQVVAIVPTGGDVTAYISRERDGADAPKTEAPAAAVETEEAVVEETTPEMKAEPDPLRIEPKTEVSEPSGWAIAPEPASSTPEPAAEPIPAYQPTIASGAMGPTPASPASAADAPAVSAAAPAAARPAEPASAPAVPAGWYADPAGRFELRYWDGGTWTEHVSRAGQQFTDPPVA
ncbi:MAG: hypothetical protein QOE00_2099 [Ilumatobacteraceae bacterium]|jgi:hypothetical protein